jgi:hypothetical protein
VATDVHFNAPISRPSKNVTDALREGAALPAVLSARPQPVPSVESR